MTETPAPNRRFLTIEQVAQELNVSEVQVRALLRSGELPGIQVGGRGVWRIGVNDVEDFIAEAYRKTAERIAAGDLGDSVQGSRNSRRGSFMPPRQGGFGLFNSYGLAPSVVVTMSHGYHRPAGDTAPGSPANACN
jgi:excisionase family DNA binding protein